MSILGIACEGNIGAGSDHGMPRDDRKPPMSGQDDELMKAANPDLHSIALRYFPGEEVANAPKRIFRLTREQLDRTTRTLLPAHHNVTALAAMPKDSLQTNYEYAAHLGWSAANFVPYTQWVEQLVAGVRAKPESVIDCASAGNAPGCLRAEARNFVARAFRGVVFELQLSRFADFFTTSVAQVGLPDATGDLVDAALTSPGYLFREEVQTDGDHFLLPAQRLQNITYTLADAPPETVSLSARPPDTYLQSADEVGKTIDRVLATPEARAKLLRFFTAWLEVKEPDEFTIAPSVFPEFTPAVAAAAAAETRTFLNHQLSQAAPKLKDVTESTQSFVTEALAALYEVKNPSATSLVELDPGRRLGVFTQPAVIASHSGPTTTRLVKRGVFFTRKVMCLELGTPPPDIDSTVTTTTGTTERQKIESATTESRCAACHAYINPFGFMQENYDAIGRWRTTDEGQPIDARISVDFLDEGTLSTDSPVDALKGFTRSALFKQCFVRQLFRFYLGRDEAPSDHPLLRKMFFNFVNHDAQDIVGLLKILANSAALSQRSEAP